VPTLAIEPLLNPHHEAIHRSVSRELLVYGGANSGKTYSIADKLLLQPLWQPGVPLRCAVVRRTLPSLRRSAYYVLEKRAADLGFPFKPNRNDWTARVFSMTFLFLSMNNEEDFQKLKSITDLDYIWINELPELREADYNELLLRLRGGKGKYDQIIADFNPIGKTTWVYKRFWETRAHDAEKLRYTIYQNHPAYLADPKTKAYIDSIKRTKDQNPNYYKIYFLGEWGELEGVIFNWDVTPLPDVAFDETFYGGDFGFTTDPSTMVRIYRKGDEYWFQEVFYEWGLTNQDIAARARSAGVGRHDDTYWDSAEPKSIEELKRAGLNAKPCRKGADSIRSGIDFLLTKKCHIVEGSEWISKEARSYVRKKDKDGNLLNAPIEHNNHAMSAIRYGMTTHLHRKRAFGAFSEKDFY
jgi:phage terminase large subunit